jgi:Flp pilus assembly protein TadD
LEYFEEAVRIDPDFALAWANLAGALHVLENEEGTPPAGTAERLRAAIERALALGPGSAEVQARAAQYYARNNEPERAEEHFRTAQSLDPDSPIVLGFLASRASWRGDFEQAVALQQRALVLDPLSSVYAGNLIVLLLAAGRAEEAGAEIEKLRTERSSLLPDHQHELASALILQDRIEDAEALVESWPEGNERLQYRAMLLHHAARSEEADEAMAKLEQVPGLEGAVRRAEVHAFRGELDRCFEELETLRRHLESGERNLPPRLWIDRARHSPYLNTTLAADPRWSAVWIEPR